MRVRDGWRMRVRDGGRVNPLEGQTHKLLTDSAVRCKGPYHIVSYHRRARTGQDMTRRAGHSSRCTEGRCSDDNMTTATTSHHFTDRTLALHCTIHTCKGISESRKILKIVPNW